MASLVKKIIGTVFVFVALTSNFSAFASENSDIKRASSGVIRFTGAIVAPPCIVQLLGQNIETKCWHDNGKEKRVSVNIKKLNGQEIALPNSKGTQKFNWINKDNTLGIYTIMYD